MVQALIIISKILFVCLLIISCDSDDKLTLCEEGYISVDTTNLCYYETDLLVLESIILSNENLIDDELLSAGIQAWEEGHLVLLDLSNNNLTLIPDDISNLLTLTNLNLGFNQLEEIPETIAEIPNLIYLGLQSNMLSQIPASIGNMETLEGLYLGDNLLSTVSISGLINLSTLWINNNALNNIPADIFNLTGLNNLDLSNNVVNVINDEIINLENLTELDISNNNISTLNSNVICEMNIHININVSNNALCDEFDNLCEIEEEEYIDINLGIQDQGNCP